MERAVEIDVDHAPPVVGRGVEEVRGDVPARAVHEPADRARIAFERGHRALDRLAVRDVGGVGESAAARARDLRDRLLGAGLVAIERTHYRALFAEPQRDRLRDAAGRSRHEHVAADESDESRQSPPVSHFDSLACSRCAKLVAGTRACDAPRSVRRTGSDSPPPPRCSPRPAAAPAPLDFSGPTADWPEYAGDKGGLHYSKLTQVTRANVGRLELAWSHRSGDFSAGNAESAPTTFQVTPLVVNDTLYYCTPYMRVFALDPETGAERWVFDPELRNKKHRRPVSADVPRCRLLGGEGAGRRGQSAVHRVGSSTARATRS